MIVPISALGSAFAPMPAQMVDGQDAARVLDLGVRAGSLQDLSGHAVALADDLARARNIRVGERIPLALGDGTPVRLRAATHRAGTRASMLRWPSMTSWDCQARVA